MKKALSEKFKMKELGEIKEYLGIEIQYNYVIGEINLSQTRYIESLADITLKKVNYIVLR